MSVRFIIFLGAYLFISMNFSYAYKPEDLEEFQRQYRAKEAIVCQGFDLRGADLSGLILRKSNFSGADLSKANFRGSDLSGSDFTLAILNGAKLKKTCLVGLIAFGMSAKGTCLEDKSFLEKNGIFFNRFSVSSEKFDLHGMPLKDITDLIDDFLGRSYENHSKIEIVMGRGLHNMNGREWKFSDFCKKYLDDNDRLYYKEIKSINREGSWLLILYKKKKYRKNISEE